MEENTGFEIFKLNKQLLSAVAEAGYETPTPIQEKAIPIILGGQDVMGIAQTGTGKTAAFVLPILMKLKYAQGNSPRCIVIAPTRELALQIAEHIQILGKNTDLRYLCAYGGVGTKAQVEALEAGIDILIATPGRLMELYFMEKLILKEIKFLVLDEADKMMDMGFMPQVRKLLEIIPRKRQNLLFSATMMPKVLRLSEEFLEFPTMIEIEQQSTPAETVTQSVYYLSNLRTKISFVEKLLLDEETFNKVIIFCKTRTTATNLGKYLQRKYLDQVRIIHANKDQNTRLKAFSDFKTGNIRILVATDVTARGIDVSLVSHVINFDVPLIYEDYVHRIGRTGRAKQSGIAITFCTEAERYHLAKIEKMIRMEIPVVPLPPYVEMFETPFEEQQEMAMEIDRQKRRDDPDFKGAFHEKKNKPKTVDKKSKKFVKNKRK